LYSEPYGETERLDLKPRSWAVLCEDLPSTCISMMSIVLSCIIDINELKMCGLSSLEMLMSLLTLTQLINADTHIR